jgi:nitrite reductase (NADH) large subunit
MKKIIVLGSSASAGGVAEEIRRLDPASEIVLVGFDGCYPHDRYLFTPVVAKEMEYPQVFSRDKKFYEQNHIQVVPDKKITRINLARNKITTEDKMTFVYDALVIADAPGYRLPSIKGVNKNGVFGFTHLKEIDNILDVLPLAETVVVQSDTLAGLQIAAAFLKRDKDVLWIVSTETILPELLEPEMGRKVAEILEDRNDKLRIICGNTIAEMLGEGEARAVRLKTGKVLATQMVILGDLQGDFRLFADSPLNIHNRICVDNRFRTNVDNVFAVGCAAEGEGLPFTGEDVVPSALYEEEARITAAALIGQPQPLARWPVVVRSVSVEGLTIDIIAETRTRDGQKGFIFADDDRKIYKKVFVEKIPLGAYLINAREELEKFRQLIEGRRTLSEFPEIVPAGFAAAHSPQEILTTAESLQRECL